jgi:hypothetical protein
MKYISPINITSAKLNSSTADADSVAAWAATTTYTSGVEARGSDRIYKSLQSSNLNHPLTDAAWWQDVRAINKMAMFDTDVSSQTFGANGLVVELLTSPVDVCDSLALINVSASSIKLEVISGNEVVHSETISLIGSVVSDWYEYFFRPFDVGSSAVFNFAPARGETLKITFYGSQVKVGFCVAGLTRTVGVTRLGGSKDLVDYSKTSADEFGSWSLTRRNFASNGSFQCEVYRDAASSVFNDLAAVRGIPTLWTGVEDDPFTVIFGILGKVRGDLATKAIRYFTVEVKGMAT